MVTRKCGQLTIHHSTRRHPAAPAPDALLVGRYNLHYDHSILDSVHPDNRNRCFLAGTVGVGRTHRHSPHVEAVGDFPT
jgi:hypothetical protein